MAVAATGFFDGVHTGHRDVIETLVRTAHERGDESLAITFWPHPRTVLQNGARDLRLLTSRDEKLQMLRSLGVDRVEVLPFTREFAAMTARQYIDEVLVGRFGAGVVVMGYDNRLGSDNRLPESIAGIEKIVVPARPAVSSTRIREALASGDVASSNAMLGYPYSLHGVVVAGNRIGRTIGFPTANMQLYEPLKAVPAVGSYLVEVQTIGRELYGMCNIGVRPTVGGSGLTIETNIFDFSEDIYGLDLTIRFLRRIRDEVRFDSLEALAAKLAEDKNNCYLYLGYGMD